VSYLSYPTLPRIEINLFTIYLNTTKMRSIYLALRILLLFLLITASNFSMEAQNYCASSPVTVHGALSVSGTKIVDQFNTPVSFAGNSLFWSNNGWGGEKYYNANVVSWLKEDWNTTIVRAAMGVEDNGGYINDPINNKNKVKAVVDAAIDNDMYVIIDWHSHHAEDHQAAAVSFFQEMAQLYGNNPNVIYEIYNEPLQVSWSNTIKPYAEAVIAAIRAIDPDNLIIVGTSTWSQDVDIASNDPITGYNNIAYTLHFYAGTHKQSLRNKAQTAMNNGIALMVTEWGTVNANGDGGVDNTSTDEWMSFLQANDLTHLNWALNDKSEGASVLKPGANVNGGWSSSNLTASGTKVKNIVENWSQYCPDGSASNSRPTVSITNPSNNSNYDAGATISVSADASDSDGSIASVQFYASGISIGTETTSPYTLNWSPSAGNYSLTAVATDNEGASTTSAPISVSIIGENGGSLAYPSGVPHSIPGVINAAHYDTGGPGISYFDTDPGNNSDENFREDEDVDAGAGSIGWIADNEWVQFTVDVETAGSYNITYEVATIQSGKFRVEFNNQDLTGSIDVNNTGGWGDFVSINSQDVTLAEGLQTMRLYFIKGPFNIADIQFELNPTNIAVSSVNVTPSELMIDENQSAMLSATVSPSNATNTSVTWNSSDANIASVSNTGLVTGINEGNATITATTADGGFSSSSSVTVNAIGSGENDLCDNPTVVSLPFSFDGEGSFCWEISEAVSSVNSWNADSLFINDVDYTNIWSNNMPDLVDGKYYVKYISSVAWAHFEANGPNGGISSTSNSKIKPTIDLLPNPVEDELNVLINNGIIYKEVSIFDAQGRRVMSQPAKGRNIKIETSSFKSGVYYLRLKGDDEHVTKTFVKGI